MIRRVFPLEWSMLKTKQETKKARDTLEHFWYESLEGTKVCITKSARKKAEIIIYRVRLDSYKGLRILVPLIAPTAGDEERKPYSRAC